MGDMQPIYIRVSRAQEVFDISEDTIRRCADKGELKLHKRGAMTFVKVSEVSAWIENKPRSSG